MPLFVRFISLTIFFALALLGCQTKTASVHETTDPLNISIHIKHLSEKEWQVTYSTDRPVERFVFQRDQNVFRKKIFKFENSEFFIGESVGKEYLARTDGKPFRQVTFRFSPYYERLERDYEFSLPFSDGSSAIYTGHFDVSSNIPVRSNFKFVFEPLQSEGLVFNAQEQFGVQEWLPKGDVTSIYVYFGRIRPHVTSSLTTLLDPGIPDWIQKLSENALPLIFKVFEQEFGLNPKPFVIVNSGDLKKSEGSSGGGSSPGWIQLGISGISWVKPSAEFRERYLKTLAHEGMHQFQGRPEGDFMQKAWLMEGSAEFFAYQALQDLGYIDAARRKERISEDTNECVQRLKQAPVVLVAPPQGANFRVVYSCGHILHYASHAVAMKSNKKGLFALWKKLYEYSEKTEGYFQNDFYFKALEEFGASEAYRNSAKNFISKAHQNPESAIRDLFVSAGVKFRMKGSKFQVL